MKALIVYETQWGNTERVARAIAAELATDLEVDVVSSEEAPTSVDQYDLLVVGAPTHAFSLSRASTREDAVRQHGAPRAPVQGVREWLRVLQEPDRPFWVVTFDTRVDKPRLPGSAAKAAKQELRSLGFEALVKQRTFRVQDYEGPLVDGELERATEWARTIRDALLGE